MRERWIASRTSPGSTIGAAWVALPDIHAALYPGSVLLGLFVGNVVALAPVIIGREFAAGSFALVSGLSRAIGQATWSFAPALLGIVRDAPGSYGAALSVCIGLLVLAALLVLRHAAAARIHAARANAAWVCSRQPGLL